jgi:hypothetical protein
MDIIVDSYCWNSYNFFSLRTTDVKVEPVHA